MSKRERTELTEETIDVLSRLISMKPGETAINLLSEKGIPVYDGEKTTIYKAIKPKEKRSALKVRLREIKKLDTLRQDR